MSGPTARYSVLGILPDEGLACVLGSSGADPAGRMRRKGSPIETTG